MRKKTTSKAAPKKTTQKAKPAKGKATVKAAAKKKAPAPPPASTGFWLLKSEPDSYSIDAFAKDSKTLWTGVRNYLARNFMMHSMRPGDRFLFYHSSAEPPAVVGIGEILATAKPDPTALDASSDYYDPKASADHPIWFCAEVGFVEKLQRQVPLEALRAEKRLSAMSLLQRGQRLSIMPLRPEEYQLVLEMAGK